MLGCRVGPTNKLARHLKTQHPINETKIKFALKIAKEYASNCELSRSIPKTDAPKKNSFANTKLVRKKHNYKICQKCDKLYLNLTDHLTAC